MVLPLEHQTWDGLSNYSQGLEYIVYFIVSLAYFYNQYVKLIWYYCTKNTRLGLACQTILQVCHLLHQENMKLLICTYFVLIEI